MAAAAILCDNSAWIHSCFQGKLKKFNQDINDLSYNSAAIQPIGLFHKSIPMIHLHQETQGNINPLAHSATHQLGGVHLV